MRTTLVSVRIVPKTRKKRVRLSARAKVADLLKALDLNPQTVVVRRNGRIVAEGEGLASGDLVEIVPIVTGGGNGCR